MSGRPSKKEATGAGTMNGITSKLILLDENQAQTDTIRERMARMSDGELLRYGMTAKLGYEQGLKRGEVSADLLTTELSEARAEWNRRYEKMPLRDSF